MPVRSRVVHTVARERAHHDTDNSPAQTTRAQRPTLADLARLDRTLTPVLAAAESIRHLRGLVLTATWLLALPLALAVVIASQHDADDLATAALIGEATVIGLASAALVILWHARRRLHAGTEAQADTHRMARQVLAEDIADTYGLTVTVEHLPVLPLDSMRVPAVCSGRLIYVHVEWHDLTTPIRVHAAD